MEASIKDVIRQRKSVRTFDGESLRPEDRQKLEQYLEKMKAPFDVPIEFRFLDAKEYGVSSPVVTGAGLYLAAKVKRAPQAEITYGYCFEKFCLYAVSIGIGTVMLAATISRKAFETAMDVGIGEVMPVASPVGYPAKKPSVRETLMRKGLKADERLPFGTLFFSKTFAEGLLPEQAGPFRDALEMARLAPSAGNKQPWRVVMCGNKVHFYEKKTKALSENPLGDIQKVDMGIALAHFDLVMQENGRIGHFAAADPGLETDGQTEYIITYELQN